MPQLNLPQGVFQMANLIKGENVIGALKGFAKVQNGDYVNYSVAVISREFEDKFGTLQQEAIEVEIPRARAEEIEKFVASNQGVLVQVPYYSQVLSGHKNGKVWAFQKRSLLKDAQIQVLNSK